MKHLQEEEHIILDEEIARVPPVVNQQKTVNTRKEKTKFARLLAALLLTSIAVTSLRGWSGSRFINDYMAVLLMAFSAASFIRIEEFAMIYRSFDKVAMKLRPWPYIVPFVTAFLGLSYFISTDAWQINFLAMLFTGLGLYSYFEQRKKHAEVTSPTLGIATRLPLIKVLLALNLVIFTLSAIMLVA